MTASRGINPETLHVALERITRRARVAADRWSADDLQNPRIDRSAVVQAMGRYLVVRGEPSKPLRWFADGTSARAHIRSRLPREPQAAYWPMIGIARALDIAWFAGAMRPPIAIYANERAATVDWESWLYAVNEFNAALANDPALTAPADLLPLDDGFPPPPDADAPIDRDWLAASLRGVLPPLRAVHPERLWTPLIDAFSAGLYFFCNGADEIVCIPRPALWVAGGRLHRENGPAVLWPSGEAHYFKEGTEVARNAIP